MFGSSVAFVGNSGRYAAVGTRVPDSPVHIFRKVQGPLGEDDFLIWQYTASVELPTSETFSVLFGISIASNDEGYIAVGAPLSAGGDSGKVFVYRPNADFTQWDLVARLTGEIGAASFGSSVAFDGRLIAVGSLDEFNGKGAVYVFEFTGMLGQQGEWTETVKLSPPDLADGAEFGGSVSLFGDSPPTLAVGAPKDTGGGSAFVYIRDDFDWISQKLLPRDIQGEYMDATRTFVHLLLFNDYSIWRPWACSTLKTGMNSGVRSPSVGVQSRSVPSTMLQYPQLEQALSACST